MPVPDADAALHALERENERLRRAVSELSILNELATAIGVARDFDEVIHIIVQRSLRAVGAEQGVVTLVNEADTDQRLLSIIAAQSAKVVENARLHEERNQILQLFGQHTSPAIAEELLRAGADTATSRRQYVCVMFLDIRGFMTFSEQHAPEDVVDYLNRLFEFMIKLINRYHGIIHQLLGDGFMAIFGAPLSHGNDSRNAVKAALAIIDRVRAACTAGALPPTRIGIGLHAGEVVAGTVGSEIHKEYKVTGDVVNLASRIEKLTKEYDAQLLVSEAVWKALEPGRFEGASIGAVDVRGCAGTVHLYKLA